MRINAWLENKDIVISVADTGPGIAQEDEEKIFEPFHQIDSSIRRRHGGSGLGLSISKQFVEMHGGKMWLESETGKGTTFYLSLPVEPRLPVAHTSSGAVRWFHPYRQYRERTRPSKAPAPQVVPCFVLLETGDALSKLFSRYAERTETISVQDIEHANRELSQMPAQALIVNASPSGNSRVTQTQLANLPYGTPAVACWVPGLDAAARRLGAISYLMKPVTSEMIVSTLEKLGGDVRTVLLVDDEPEVLQLFTRMLTSEKHGYRVLQTTSGRRALDMLRERQPDVMLLDLIMPGVDGFQLMQEKSQDASIRNIPVVVITSADPAGEPIVSDTLTVTRGSGLSGRDLVACIRAISEILSPSA